MTLGGRHIVVCRATVQSGPLLDAIEQAGGVAVHVPLIEVVPPLDGGAALRQVLTSGGHEWLAVTSANGIDAVAALGVELPRRLAVVGRATARRAIELGLEVAFEPTEASAAALGRALPAEGSRVVAALAELASDDLVTELGRRDIAVDRVIAYRTVAPKIDAADLDRIHAADVVLVTSPSVIHRLLDHLDPLELPPLVAIGKTTAAAITERGLTVAATALEPSPDGLIDAALHSLAS